MTNLIAMLEEFSEWDPDTGPEAEGAVEYWEEYAACRREVVHALHGYFTKKGSSSLYHEGDIDIFVDQSPTCLTWKAMTVLRQGPLRRSHQDVQGNNLTSRILSFVQDEDTYVLREEEEEERSGDEPTGKCRMRILGYMGCLVSIVFPFNVGLFLLF